MKLSPVWEQIKQKTTLRNQLLKEKTGVVQTDLVDPDFEISTEHLEILHEQFKVFLTDVEDILKIIPNILESGQTFSETLKQTNNQTGEKLSNISVHFENFFRSIEKTCADQLLEPADRVVLESLKNLSDKFNDLDSIKKQRYETQLLYDNYKYHLDKAKSKGNEEKIKKYSNLTNSKREEWTNLTDVYKSTIDGMWENRYKILSHPLEQFTGVLFKFCFECFKSLRELQKAATPEELMTDFGTDETKQDGH